MNGLLQVNKKRVRVTLRIGTEKIDLMVEKDKVASYRAAGKRVNKMFSTYRTRCPYFSVERIYAMTLLACALEEGCKTQTEK